MFEGFTRTLLPTPEATICVRQGGSGPPLLLLHGHPQTHVMWHLTAPALARDYTVVCADLRGYGDSSKPPTTPDHEPLLQAGDGARPGRADGASSGLSASRSPATTAAGASPIAWRSTIPARVRELAVLDIVPTGEHFRRADMDFGARLLALVLPRAALRPARAADRREPRRVSTSTRGREAFDPAADAPTITCAATATRRRSTPCARTTGPARPSTSPSTRPTGGGRKIACPLLALWGAKGQVGELV